MEGLSPVPQGSQDFGGGCMAMLQVHEDRWPLTSCPGPSHHPDHCIFSHTQNLTSQYPRELSSRHPCPGSHPDPTWPTPVHPKPYLNVQKMPGNGGGSPGPGTSYLISVWPPAFRAICTSSFPYRSSAWALQEQSMGIASPPVLLAMAPSNICRSIKSL